MSDKALFLDYKNYYKYHKKQYSDVLSDLGYLEFVHDKLQKEIEDIDVGIDPQLEAKVNTNTQNISDLDTKVKAIETGEISLGETSATAYRGDRGKTAYDHSQETSGNPHNVTKSQVGLGNVNNTSDIDKPISTATQTALDLKADDVDLDSHITDLNNPHQVTKADVGLENADNTSDLDKPVSTATQTALGLKADNTTVDAHINDTNNPHGVTKSDVGLENVENTADLDKPISSATQNALNDKADSTDLNDYIPLTQKGVNSGVAELNSSGKVPANQLPSFVDYEVFRDSQTTAMSKSDLNTAYPDTLRGFQVVCREIDLIYKKVDDNNDNWISISIVNVT